MDAPSRGGSSEASNLERKEEVQSEGFARTVVGCGRSCDEERDSGFDIKIYVKKFKSNEIKNSVIEKSLKRRIKIRHIRINGNFIGIKIDCCENGDMPTLFYKAYRGLRRFIELPNIEFGSIFFETPASSEREKFMEVNVHLSALGLPLDIVGSSFTNEDLSFHDVKVVMEDRNWPKDIRAENAVKTALYCQIFIKSEYRHRINRDYVILKYKGSNFKLNVERFDATEALRKAIENKDGGWHKNVRMIKVFLNGFGFYPMNISEVLLNLWCLGLCEHTQTAFFDKFLMKMGCDYNGEKIYLSDNIFVVIPRIEDAIDKNKQNVVLTNCGVRVTVCKCPEMITMKRLSALCLHFQNLKFRVFDSMKNIVTSEYLIPSIEDYDFVLSKYKRNRFSKIEKKVMACDVECLQNDFEMFAHLYYSSIHGILMVKCRKVSPRVICGLILLKCHFNYVIFPNHDILPGKAENKG